jgi:hypothetical protein
MSTKTTYTTNEINHRVRSGGTYWKQYKIVNKQDAWYFTAEAKLADTAQPKWLITNSNFAKLICVSAKNLASYGTCHRDNFTVYHDDAPTHFVTEEIKPTKRTRQLLWTLEGVDYLINKSHIRLSDIIKADMRVWLSQQKAMHSNLPLYQAQPTATRPSPSRNIKEAPSITRFKPATDDKEYLLDAVHHITNIIDQLFIERNKRRELESEVLVLRAKIAQAAVKPAAKVNYLNIDNNKDNGVYVSTDASLSQYISRKGNKQCKADQLTRLGLLNSDQLYSLFSESWIDPSTNKLIRKSDFQELLRNVFHTKNSTHRTPILKSEMVRDNMVVVCQVFCKKKPNPTDAQGNRLELDNPAYLYSPEPCVRFQTRYTAKAIDYLRNNWYMTLESSSGLTTKA